MSKVGSFMDDLPDYPGKRPPINRPDSPKHKLTSAEAAERWDANPQRFMLKGQEVELFKVGALAKALDRRPVTIRAWETEGLIPQANFRTPTPKGEQVPGKQVKGRRLYLRSQIEFLILAVKQYHMGDPKKADKAGFRAHVAKHWPSN